MCIRIYCVGFSPQRSALTLVVMVHPPSIIIYIDAFVFSPRYKKGTFPFAANGRAMSVNETEGMIKVRVAWMRGGCVCMNCMRARLCEWCLRACVSQPGIHLPHTLLAALSHSSPPPIHSSTPPRLHLSASPPLRLSASPCDDQGVGARGDGPNSWYPYYRCQRRRTYRRRGSRDGVRPTPYALCVSVSVLVLVSVSVSTWLNRAERG